MSPTALYIIAGVPVAGDTRFHVGPQWQPIETAPKDGAAVLGCDEQADDYYPFSMRWEPTYGWGDPNWDGQYNPTHWQPLPARLAAAADFSIAKTGDPLMKRLAEIVAIWRTGCSNTVPGRPHECSECTQAAIKAIETAMFSGGKQNEGQTTT